MWDIRIVSKINHPESYTDKIEKEDFFKCVGNPQEALSIALQNRDNDGELFAILITKGKE